MASVEFNLDDFKSFIKRLRDAANGDFKKALATFMQGLGNDFLEVIQNEILRRNVINTRNLLTSFSSGNDVWEIRDGGLTLEVGTNVEYAKYVNDGHWANPQGVESRFVPGRWQGDQFIYDPDAKTGMVLKQQWIEGSHYWDSAVRIFEKMFPGILDKKLQEWLDQYFSDFI